MAQLSYTSFDNGYSITTSGVVNRQFPAVPTALGNAAVITHASLATATLNVRTSIVDDVPTDVIGLLGTNLIRGDQVGFDAFKGGVLQFSRALTTIADDWPLGKPRHLIVAQARSGLNLPPWIDQFRFTVRFQGTRYFGRAWIGPSIKFAPLVDLGYSYNDPGSKIDRTITGAAAAVEMPIRRATSAGCQNVTQGTAFDDAQTLPLGQTVPILRNFRALFEAGYLRRGSRMLFVPNELDPYQSRMAEYCRLTSDVALRHLQGPKLALSLSVEED